MPPFEPLPTERAALIARIKNVQFRPTRFQRGYDEREVDDFLDAVIASLAASAVPFTPAQIRDQNSARCRSRAGTRSNRSTTFVPSSPRPSSSCTSGWRSQSVTQIRSPLPRHPTRRILHGSLGLDAEHLRPDQHGRLDGFVDLLADDFVEHEVTPGLAPTKEGVKQFFSMYIGGLSRPALHRRRRFCRAATRSSAGSPRPAPTRADFMGMPADRQEHQHPAHRYHPFR